MQEALKSAQRITVIQAENPDGDSLGSALALEELLSKQGKEVSLYCPVTIPKYLRYAKGGDRVIDEFDFKSDVAIIVDTASKTLLDKALTPENISHLKKIPVFVIDHHDTASDLPFEHEMLNDQTAVSTSEVIYRLANEYQWNITPLAAEQLLLALLSDSLGLTSEAITSKSVRIVAELLDKGASIALIETARREYMKKTQSILQYKGKLLERIEYYLEGQLALVHVPWEEIEQYSDQYNPGALVIDEMRLVEGVKIAVVIKTYPDGKLTGKIRVNPEAKIAETVASYFGGGGHVYAAGFRVYESYETILKELIDVTAKALEDYNAANTSQHPDTTA